MYKNGAHSDKINISDEPGPCGLFCFLLLLNPTKVKKEKMEEVGTSESFDSVIFFIMFYCFFTGKYHYCIDYNRKIHRKINKNSVPV